MAHPSEGALVRRVGGLLVKATPRSSEEHRAELLLEPVADECTARQVATVWLYRRGGQLIAKTASLLTGRYRLRWAGDPVSQNAAKPPTIKVEAGEVVEVTIPRGPR